MIANVFARFDAMSASAMSSCISTPVATGIGDVTAGDLFSANNGTFVPLESVSRFTMRLRASLV
jgi:hypothetical protein